MHLYGFRLNLDQLESKLKNKAACIVKNDKLYIFSHKKLNFFEYNFNGFYDSNNAYYVSKGVVLPPVEPAVFELKNPKQNIRGVVL